MDASPWSQEEAVRSPDVALEVAVSCSMWLLRTEIKFLTSEASHSYNYVS